MKKELKLFITICIGVFLISSHLYIQRFKDLKSTAYLSNSGTSTNSYNSETEKAVKEVEQPLTDKELINAWNKNNENAASLIEIKEDKKNVNSTLMKDETLSAKLDVPSTSKSSLSRGGSSSPRQAASASPAPIKNTELLDWWKQGQYAFEIGSVATVVDLYSGKTFKIKRTMGSNHADCEALTSEDTNIIKNIWGGFSWTRRPVHLLINNRVLAASMSAMPHAGLDSAPAFAVVDNRSQGYGRGDNLDVIKDNGMDGHFDVHFLNSTRHKDGKADSQHQAAVKIAGSK